MKLGLGKLRDVLKTGSGTGSQEDKIEQVEWKDKAEKEEILKIKNEEIKPETSEANKMELKKTGMELKKGPLSPADRTDAKKTGLIFFPAFDWAISLTHP